MAQKSSHILIWQYDRGNSELININIRNVLDIPLASGRWFFLAQLDTSWGNDLT